MKKADEAAINQYGIPGLILMENAALSVLEILKNIFPNLYNMRVTVLAGKGNNGGDGFVIARHLLRRGAKVDIFSTAGIDELKGDAAVNAGILNRCQVPIVKINDGTNKLLHEALSSSQLIVDSLLGTGFKDSPRSPLKDIIGLANKAPGKVVAVDIPSGVNAATGEVAGESIKADITVTFAFPKAGLLLYPGAAHCGEVYVADIGIPPQVINDIEAKGRVVTPRDVAEKLPHRLINAHKGTYGRALIMAGSPGMTGAALLAGRAALRGGAGLAYIALPGAAAAALESKALEEVVIPLKGDAEGNFTLPDLSQLKPWFNSCSALAFGPGTSPGEENRLFINKLCQETSLPLVLDAGGLGALALSPGKMPVFPPGTVITPHPGEMAGLCRCTVKEVEESRLKLSLQKAKEWGVIVVLKGAPTVITSPQGAVFINSSGNTALSTAGTGDVLTGLITSLIAQGLEPLSAAWCGVYLHGLAADLWVKGNNLRGALAGDFIEKLNPAFNLLEKNSGRTGSYGPLAPSKQDQGIVEENLLYFHNC